MRRGWTVWLVAILLSVVAHGALFVSLNPEELLDGERGAGAPAAIEWGLTLNSMSETMEPVDDIDGSVEPESVQEEAVETEETVKPVEMVEAVEQPKPKEATETTSETPVDVPVETPMETTVPQEAAPAALAPVVEAAQEVVSEVEPEEVETEEAVETLTASEPPPPPKQQKKKRVQQRIVGGPKGQVTGNDGRRPSTAGANLSSYNSRVMAHLRRHKRFPRQASRSGPKVTATVKFVLDANGQVRSVSLARSSGNSAFDQEALAMVRRASPFPPIPANAGLSSKIYTVPVRYR